MSIGNEEVCSEIGEYFIMDQRDLSTSLHETEAEDLVSQRGAHETMCYMIMNNWCNSISGELRRNVSILHDMIDIRDGVKECDSLCIDDVLFIIDDICIN